MADKWFVGLRATDDLVSNERPESWRDGMIRIFPNGTATLTALTTLMSKEKITDPHYHWWTKTLTTQRGAITDAFTDASMSATLGSGAASASGITLYFQVAAATAAMFRVGHIAMMRDSARPLVDCRGIVTAVVDNGSSSSIGVKLLEADDNDGSGATYGMETADVIMVIGNANAQGATRPEAITQGPTELDNYPQIFRNSLDLSRTLLETKLRTAPAYQEAKRDALEQHSIEIEKSFLWGLKTSGGVGSNGKPLYTTGGLIDSIRSSGVVQDYVTDSSVTYAGKTWLDGGVDWIDEHLEEMFRYGSTERLVFCGSGALLGIQRLVRELGVYNLTPQTTSFGLKVIEWVTPFGSIMLKTHPLFSYEATNRHAMVLFEPANIKYRFVTDTKFMVDTAYGKGGGSGKDGKEEEFLTEAGLEFHQPITCAYLSGVGLNNTV